MNILFVCTGNTCRSPMAEAILRSMNVENIDVRSAGVFAANGSDASTHAKKVLEMNDINHRHQSKLLTKEALDWADYIFTMTNSHKQSIVSQIPQAVEKTFTLKEFVKEDGYDLDVLDPFGGTLEIYQATYKELSDLIQQLVIKLEKIS